MAEPSHHGCYKNCFEYIYNLDNYIELLLYICYIVMFFTNFQLLNNWNMVKFAVACYTHAWIEISDRNMLSPYRRMLHTCVNWNAAAHILETDEPVACYTHAWIKIRIRKQSGQLQTSHVIYMRELKSVNIS